MNPIIMNVLGWWQKADVRVWIPWLVKVAASVGLAAAAFWMTVEMRDWRERHRRGLAIAEGLERARMENAREQRHWQTLTPQGFQQRAVEYLQSLGEEAGVTVLAMTPYRTPGTPVREAESSVWRRVSLVVQVEGPLSHSLTYFYLVKRDPLVVEISGLAAEGQTSKVRMTAIIELVGMGWPVTGFPSAMPSSTTSWLARLGDAFTEYRPPQSAAFKPPPPKPQPAWRLTGLAGGAVYLSREGSDEMRVVTHGSQLYGWTIEVPEDAVVKGIRLRKGGTTLVWPMRAYFNGIEVKKADK